MDEQLARTDAQVSNRAEKTSPWTLLPPACLLISPASAGAVLSSFLSACSICHERRSSTLRLSSWVWPFTSSRSHLVYLDLSQSQEYSWQHSSFWSLLCLALMCPLNPLLSGFTWSLLQHSHFCSMLIFKVHFSWTAHSLVQIFIQSDSFCLFFEVFRPFVFIVIIKLALLLF